MAEIKPTKLVALEIVQNFIKWTMNRDKISRDYYLEKAEDFIFSSEFVDEIENNKEAIREDLWKT